MYDIFITVVIKLGLIILTRNCLELDLRASFEVTKKKLTMKINMKWVGEGKKAMEKASAEFFEIREQ